ncbi:hypothetical protein [Microbulbifer sp. VAAF005]
MTACKETNHTDLYRAIWEPILKKFTTF